MLYYHVHWVVGLVVGGSIIQLITAVRGQQPLLQELFEAWGCEDLGIVDASGEFDHKAHKDATVAAGFLDTDAVEVMAVLIT
uniref:Uncharacterized protein n=1 Tax=Sphaerodactylus townsendi TaxID=933632 RepID=A0ACB8FHS9_9SAUR